MKNFRTYAVAVEFYRQIRELRLPTYLKDQLNRAASSAVLNLAEGYGRTSAADQRRFYTIAMGSIRECSAILDLSENSSSELQDLADKLAAHTFKLIRGKREG